MTRLPPLCAALALLATTSAFAEPGRAYLASIAGIVLGADEYVDRFTIDTWGVDVLSVCRIPPGWRIRAGKDATPGGVIEGEASHGVTFLNRARLPALDGLALVRLDGPVRVGDGRVPATFSGHVEIGTYGVGERRRRVRLTDANIRLTPAARCPAPTR